MLEIWNILFSLSPLDMGQETCAIPPFGKLRFFLRNASLRDAAQTQTCRAALTELCASKTTAFYPLKRGGY